MELDEIIRNYIKRKKRDSTRKDIVDKIKSRSKISNQGIENSIGVGDTIIYHIKGRDRYEERNPVVDVGKISGNYSLYLNDESIDNPFLLSSELVRIIRNHTKNCHDDKKLSRKIFGWIEDNVEYGMTQRKIRGVGYKSTKEVVLDKEGICGEMAYLYITMARSCGLKSSYVSVKRDITGKKVSHACAMVRLTDDNKKSRNILVDPAYHTYDIKHKEYEILSDSAVLQRYSQWRNTK